MDHNTIPSYCGKYIKVPTVPREICTRCASEQSNTNTGEGGAKHVIDRRREDAGAGART